MNSSPPFAAPFRFPRWLRCGIALLVRRCRLAASCATSLAALAVPAFGQISFTFTATPEYPYPSLGYAAGQTYTFVFSSAPSFSATNDNFFSGSSNRWVESSAADQQMWTSLGGTGLLGAHQRPAVNPWSWLSHSYDEEDGNFLQIQAGQNFSSGLSVTTPSGVGIQRLNVESSGGTWPPFLFSALYTEPFSAATGYFSSYFGTYSVGGFISVDGISPASFRISSLTIGPTSAVPEPATSGALVGLAGLLAAGGVKWRRARRSC